MYEERTGIVVDTVSILIAVEGNECQLFQVKRDDWIGKYIQVRNDYQSVKGV